MPDFPITALLTFDDAPSYDEICTIVIAGLLCDKRFERFRSVPVEAPGGALAWQVLPHVDVARHVSAREVPSEASLRAAVDALLVEPFPPSEPLWRVSLLTSRDRARAVLLIQVRAGGPSGTGEGRGPGSERSISFGT